MARRRGALSVGDEERLPWEGLSAANARPTRRAGLVVDPRRCVGCHACGVACKAEHDVPLGGFRIRTHYLRRPDRPTHQFIPLMCQHCQEAPCLAACPNDAIQRAADGHVSIDRARCEGAHACVDACPYGAIYIDPQTQQADSCDLCASRRGVGLAPACVEVCPTGALRFGDLDDPQDPAAAYAEERAARAFRPEHGTRPTTVYVGLERWMEEAARAVQLHPDDNDIVYERP